MAETSSLRELLQKFDTDERSWKLIEARIERGLTLDETGKILGGITRERVRQLEAKIKRLLKKRELVLSPLLDTLEKNISSVISRYYKNVSLNNRTVTRKYVSLQVGSAIKNYGYDSSAEDVEKLITLVRAMVFWYSPHDKDVSPQKIWPNLTLIFCKIRPLIKRHEKIAQWIENYSDATKK